MKVGERYRRSPHANRAYVDEILIIKFHGTTCHYVSYCDGRASDGHHVSYEGLKRILKEHFQKVN